MCFYELEGVFKADCKSDFVKGAVCQCAQGVGLIIVCVKKKKKKSWVNRNRQTEMGSWS